MVARGTAIRDTNGIDDEDVEEDDDVEVEDSEVEELPMIGGDGMKGPI